MLLFFCLMLSCKPLTHNIISGPKYEVSAYDPLPDIMPIHLLYAEEKIPESSLYVNTASLINQVDYGSKGKFYLSISDALKSARRQGANIIQIFESEKKFASNTIAELYFYRNMDISNYELKKSRNASSLPKDANYAKIYFYNDYDKLRDCILTNTANETIGNISQKSKMEFKTTAFGLQTFKLAGFGKSAIELDVQVGKEYYVRIGKTGATQDYSDNLKLEILENCVGRHYYNKLAPKK